jgi:inorganic pyrophosphatase/exopolyphosphatase
MGIPSYLEVISVIDHHKSSLATSSAPMAIIADAQSTMRH